MLQRGLRAAIRTGLRFFLLSGLNAIQVRVGLDFFLLRIFMQFVVT